MTLSVVGTTRYSQDRLLINFWTAPKEKILPGITQRTAIAESVLMGLTLREYAPSSEGVKEFTDMATAICFCQNGRPLRFGKSGAYRTGYFIFPSVSPKV